MNFFQGIQAALRAPRWGDSSLDRKSQVFNAILLISSGLLILLLAASMILNPGGFPGRALIAGILFFHLVLLLVLRHAGPVSTAKFLTIGYWFILSGTVFISGGLGSVSLFSQILLVFAVGLILSGRAALVFAALTILFNFAVLALQMNWMLPRPVISEPITMRWLIHSVILLMAGLLIFWANRSISESLRQAGRNEGRYRALFERTNDAIFVVALDGKIASVNQRAADMLGYAIEELIAKPYQDLVPSEERENVRQNFSDLKSEDITPLFERTLITKAGVPRKVEFNATVVKDDRGQILHYLGVARDVTERKRAEAKFRGLLEAAPDAMVIVNPDGVITLVNAQAEVLFGYTRHEMLGQAVENLMPARFRDLHPKHRGGYVAAPHTRAMGPGFDLFGLRKDGSEFPVEVTLSPLDTDEGVLISAAIRDISERKRLEAQLKFSLDEMETLAMQDHLTGLLNRRAISEHADAEWHRAQREKRPVCIIVIDLDNLKIVNDKLGHQQGDQVIIELARVIRESCRRYDWAGRWGGDEFLLVLPGANLSVAEEVAERIRSGYSSSELINSIRAEEVRSFVSLGVACYSGRPGDEITLDQLITQADKVLYDAKQGGRNRVGVYRS
ncbi:MAG: sensor domain-containing diguanylate cyclase [Anaerolineales bacterium]